MWWILKYIAKLRKKTDTFAFGWEKYAFHDRMHLIFL